MMLSLPPLSRSSNPKIFANLQPKKSIRFPTPRSHGHSPLHQVSLPGPTNTGDEGEGEGEGEGLSPSFVAAVAAAIRRSSPSSPVRFTRRVEQKKKSGIVLPSPDFQRLCVEQLDLFRMVVHRDAVLSVFVRPAGSYVMDQLELRGVTFYPGIDMSENAECIILIGNFTVPAGLRAAEASLSKQQVEFIPEYGAVVLPMVKHPFVVGFLVAEIPAIKMETCENPLSGGQDVAFSLTKDGPPALRPRSDNKMWEIQPFKEEPIRNCAHLTIEQKSRAIMITRSLAMAYVMDQKAMLLQQSSWQNNVRMSHLVEQIHGSLSSIRALTKMLSVHAKRSEISHDIIEGILMQGEHLKDAIQQLQDAVYITKANIVQYNEDTLRRMHDSEHHSQQEEEGSSLSSHHLRDPEENNSQMINLSSGRKDVEMPMPPLLLAPLQNHNIRPCTVSDVLKDLVGAAVPLASKQQRLLQLNVVIHPLHVAVEESALRQSLSNLIEGSLLRTQIYGRVDIYATAAPAGGALIVIDDNGPDMHYMTQMHALMPFGADLLSDGQVEDNMTWNFIAGLAVAREILESYGCVVRVISPRDPDAALAARGTRIELWLPSFQPDSLAPAGVEA